MSEYGWFLELSDVFEAKKVAPEQVGLDKHVFGHEHVVLIDHHDSFTQTIKSYIEQLGANVTVVQHTDKVLSRLEVLKPTRLILSPGPGHPTEAVRAKALIQDYYTQYPMLGICLGHQCLIEAFGGCVIQSEEIHHGKQSVIYHDDREGLFHGLPSTFLATRYHSLVMDESSLSLDWKTTAWTYDKKGRRVVMGIRHCHYPLFGVQYHPEAILTEQGMPLLVNFMKHHHIALG